MLILYEGLSALSEMCFKYTADRRRCIKKFLILEAKGPNIDFTTISASPWHLLHS